MNPTTFKANPKATMPAARVVAWFGQRGEAIQRKHIVKHRVGTIITEEGERLPALAVVLKCGGWSSHLDTVKGEIDLYPLQSMACELYDSIADCDEARS